MLNLCAAEIFSRALLRLGLLCNPPPLPPRPCVIKFGSLAYSLGQLGPDLLRILLGLADYAARNQVPTELQDLSHLDIDSPSQAQAVFLFFLCAGLIPDPGRCF